jgi:transglutaminase-like putative cysteine protease
MALIKYKNPPIVPATGAGTFSDDLVGFQLVTGGGLTQGNFEFTQSITEKNNRTFNTGNFSNPISLEGLGVESVAQSKVIFEKNFKVYPNYDLSDITNFTLYGSMTKRISTSIESILSKFPASIDTTFISSNYSTGETASNISYSEIDDTTTFELNVSKIRNPFDIDFTTNSTRNLQLREVQVSPLRNMTTQYGKYSLYYNGTGYELNGIIPTSSSCNGVLTI